MKGGKGIIGEKFPNFTHVESLEGIDTSRLGNHFAIQSTLRQERAATVVLANCDTVKVMLMNIARAVGDKQAVWTTTFTDNGSVYVEAWVLLSEEEALARQMEEVAVK